MMKSRINNNNLSISTTSVWIVLAFISVTMLYPFYYMLVTSAHTANQYNMGYGWSFMTWVNIFRTIPIIPEIIHSFIVCCGSIIIILLFSSMAGYAFAKLEYPFSRTVLILVISGMMVPMQSIIIPEYINLSNLGMVGNFTGAILVYSALGVPFSTFLMTTYYRSLPDDLIEASIMDGLSYFTVYWRMMIPMSIPALITVAVLQFISIWNDLLIAMLFLPTPEVRTITVGLATLQSTHSVDVPQLMAGSILSSLPCIIVYFIFKRYLVTGLTLGMTK